MTVSGSVYYDSWTGQPKLIPCQFRRLCVQPLKYVDRKIMLYTIAMDSRLQYTDIDPEGPVYLKDVAIPYLPKEQEVVLMKNGAVIHVSAVGSDRVTGYQLRKIAGSLELLPVASLQTSVTEKV